jgi:hypothetical protein
MPTDAGRRSVAPPEPATVVRLIVRITPNKINEFTV